MRRILAKVDDGRFGRAVAGLVTGTLVVECVARGEKEIVADVCSVGKTGSRAYTVLLRGRQVFCTCRDYRERGVHCKHVAAVVLHKLGAAARGITPAPPQITGQPPRVKLRIKLSGQRRTWQATPARVINWKVHAGPPGVPVHVGQRAGDASRGQAPGSRITGTLASLRGPRASADCRQPGGHA